MTGGNLLFTCFFLSLLLFNCSANDKKYPLCVPSSCGNIHNITFPFRLKSDPHGCGVEAYELSCEDNSTVLHLPGAKFIVKAINYNNHTIRVVDTGLDEKVNCSSLPRSLFSLEDFSYRNSDAFLARGADYVLVMKCVKPVNTTAYVDANSCFEQLKDGFYRYAYVRSKKGMLDVYMIREGCSVEAMTLLQSPDYSMSTFADIHRRMAFGFEFSWKFSDHSLAAFIRAILAYAEDFFYAVLDSCQYILTFFGSHFNIKKVLDNIKDDLGYFEAPPPTLFWLFHASGLVVVCIVGRSLCGSPFVMAFIIFKWTKRHRSGYHTIEEFLEGENNPIMPVRYAYSDIKKMTGGFKEMLGKGGFGSVYKGKLRSGQFTAVKMLETSKSQGQDFINEVATIGRIHHANIVRLIGYCSQGSKNALVYEFMSNGSLDTHIFNEELSSALSWEKLYETALGIARGIEYLHQGCDMQILHFDIKPHNILLDENFTPKISDFGLAKFYPKMGKSFTKGKGTIGYMAPELFYGRVSYKVDVYSFGMLLLEMTGKRKNLKVPTGVPSDASMSLIYYPLLVYDKLVDGNLEIEDATYEENKMVRKMIITGLWCIQMQPSDRPSMSEVVEMLEGNLEDLPFPSRPLENRIESTQINEGELSFISQMESTQTNEEESSSYATCKSALSSNKTDENPTQLD